MAPRHRRTSVRRLLELPPEGFERLAQRVLREAGFLNVTVTGKSGDGGIDGVGVYRLSLVSFPRVLPVQALQGDRRQRGMGQALLRYV